uniref:Uncharacterized protein n=2 Tax=Lygus hesperus TaxID=30085 RepID=A0A146L3K9_LYGHE
MATKRDFDVGNDNAANEDLVPAKIGRLEDDEEHDLVIDLPPEDVEETDSEVSKQNVTSCQSNHGESDKSELNVDVESNLEQGVIEEGVKERLSTVTQMNKNVNQDTIDENDLITLQVKDSQNPDAEIADKSGEVENAEIGAHRDQVENAGIAAHRDEVENAESVLEMDHEVLISDQSSQHESDSGDSIVEFVGTCESNSGSAEKTNADFETSNSEGGNSNCVVVSKESTQGSVHAIYPRNHIDEAIDRVIENSTRYCDEQNVIDLSSDEICDSGDQVIDISSDSEEEDSNSQNPTDEDNRKSTNIHRFIRIMPRVSSQGGPVGKSLSKTKTVIIGTPTTSNHAIVIPRHQSSLTFGSITSSAQSSAIHCVPETMTASDSTSATRVPSGNVPILPKVPITVRASTVAVPANVPILLKPAVKILPKPVPSEMPAQLDEELVPDINNLLAVPPQAPADVVDTEDQTHKGCVIKTLLAKSFTGDGMSDTRRLEVLLTGRPCPVMSTSTYNIDQKGQLELYKTIPWLTGSSELNRWYCWPCLLYCPSESWSWDPKKFNKANFLVAAEKHEIKSEHLEAAVRMKTHELGIKKNLHAPTIQSKNENVRRNRHFFKLLVEVVCTVKKKLNNMYTSQVDCIDLINLISTYDSELKDYLRQLSKSSKDAPANLVSSYVGGVLASVEKQIRSKIKSDLDETRFVCLILEDTSDVVDKSWVSVIARFVNEKGDVFERFVKFVEVGYGRTPADILPLFQKIVKELDCADKLVAFTYGGTFIEPPLTSMFNSQVSSLYPTAQFFHYKEHDFRRLICQALSHLKYTRGFFQCISDLSDFFESTPNAVKTLVAIDKDIHDDQQTLVWDFSSGFIKTIQDHYASIVKFLMKIIAWPSDWTGEAAIQAPYFLNVLRKVQNRFFIVLLSKIFTAVEPLTKAKEENIDVDEWKLLAKRAALALFLMKKYSFDEVVELACSNSLSKESISSDSVTSLEMKSALYKDTYNEIIDYVATIISSRNNGAELSFIRLQNFMQPLENTESDNRSSIINRIVLNMKISDVSRLEPQIKFFRTNKFFNNKSFSHSIRYFNELAFGEFLPDLSKLLQLLVTIPTIHSSEPSLKPKIKRVKTYIRGKEELNSVDALMWIEKDMIDKLQEEPRFYDNVIDIFVEYYCNSRSFPLN